MARRFKIFEPNNIYFITFTILGWKNIFVNDEYCSLVYKWFDYVKNKYSNLIHGYVIMPNHVHCLIYVTDRSPQMPILIMNAKRYLAYGIINLLKKENKKEPLNFFSRYARTSDWAIHRVFTDRYDSLIIQGQKFFLEKLNYIHNNPLKGNLANNPEDYRYSSASNYLNSKGVYEINVLEW